MSMKIWNLTSVTKNTAIYINKGIGTWGIKFRYKADAEITILKLISKSVE